MYDFCCCFFSLQPGHTTSCRIAHTYAHCMGSYAMACWSNEHTFSSIRMQLCYMAHRNGYRITLSNLYDLLGSWSEYFSYEFIVTIYIISFIGRQVRNIMKPMVLTFEIYVTIIIKYSHRLEFCVTVSNEFMRGIHLCAVQIQENT